MFVKLLFCFIIIPFIEVVLLVKLGTIIGFWETVSIQVVSGFIGATLARVQGAVVFKKIQTELANNRLPAQELLDGLLIFVAGIVLLTPGLITDALGLALLFPMTRYMFKQSLQRKLKAVLQKQNNNFSFFINPMNVQPDKEVFEQKVEYRVHPDTSPEQQENG